MTAVLLGFHLAILVGELVIVGMIWHLSRVVKQHDDRADGEWINTRQKLDAALKGQQNGADTHGSTRP